MLTMDGKPCHFLDVGSGFPILFGHSYLWDSQMWEPQVKTLSKKFRCIVPDLWDHGRSGRLGSSAVTIEEIAAHAWKLMQHLKIRKFAIVGLSVGGMWGAELAMRHPEAVKALVLMDTYLGSEPQATRQKYFSLIEFLEKEKRFSPPLLNQVVPLFFSPETLAKNPHLVDRFRSSLASISEERIAGIAALGRAIFSRNCKLDKLPALVQPTLILVGKDDIPRPPREAEEMASRLPNGQLRVIEEAGHISNLEQPEKVSALLSEFLFKSTL